MGSALVCKRKAGVSLKVYIAIKRCNLPLPHKNVNFPVQCFTEEEGTPAATMLAQVIHLSGGDARGGIV